MHESSPEKGVPLHVLRPFYFIGCNYILCPSLTRVNAPTAWWVPSSRLPLSGGQAACRARCIKLWGTHRCQRHSGATSGLPGVSRGAVDTGGWTPTSRSDPGSSGGPSCLGCPRGHPGRSEAAAWRFRGRPADTPGPG